MVKQKTNMDIINENYMLTSETIPKYMLTSETTRDFKPMKQTSQRKHDQKNDQKKYVKDDLFWTIYKLVHDTDTNALHEMTNCFVVEKEFKIKCIEELRTIKSKLKIHKFSLSEVENQLLNEKTINLTAFFALALLFNLNIFYIWENKYYEFNCGELKPIIIKNTNNSITIVDEPILFYKENYFQVENFKKPIKSITNYNKEELLTIAKKLNIVITNSKLIKSDLYQQILTKV